MTEGVPEGIRGVQFLRSPDATSNSTAAAFCARMRAGGRTLAPSARLSLLVVSLLFVGACTSPADVGEPCTDTADCKGGLSCIAQGSATDAPTVCMTDCDLTMTRLCDGGEVCTTVLSAGRDPNLGVCYLGGATAIGAACTANLECVAGAICVSTGGTQACYRACSTDESDCGGAETCVGLSGMGTAGFCQATP